MSQETKIPTAPISVREAAAKGGRTAAQRHGHEHYLHIGTKGGAVLREKYSHEHFAALGRKGAAARKAKSVGAEPPTEEPAPVSVAEAGRRGGTATSERHSTEHYQRMGAMGGAKVASERGHEHFVAIGRKGAQRRRELIEAGKRALAEEE